MSRTPEEKKFHQECEANFGSSNIIIVGEPTYAWMVDGVWKGPFTAEEMEQGRKAYERKKVTK